MNESPYEVRVRSATPPADLASSLLAARRQHTHVRVACVGPRAVAAAVKAVCTMNRVEGKHSLLPSMGMREGVNVTYFDLVPEAAL